MNQSQYFGHTNTNKRIHKFNRIKIEYLLFEIDSCLCQWNRYNHSMVQYDKYWAPVNRVPGAFLKRKNLAFAIQMALHWLKLHVPTSRPSILYPLKYSTQILMVYWTVWTILKEIGRVSWWAISLPNVHVHLLQFLDVSNFSMILRLNPIR